MSKSQLSRLSAQVPEIRRLALQYEQLRIDNARLRDACQKLSTELIEACDRDNFMPDEAAEALSEARVLLAELEAKP